MSFRMTKPASRALVAAAAGATALTGAVLFGLPAAGAATASGAGPVALPPGFTATTFATGGALTRPDDISRLDGNVFVAYQNGVGSMGEPSAAGAKDSTLVEYSPNGTTLASWNLTGKIDGMSADRAHHRIVATVNEDGNSSLYTVTPGATGQQVQHYTYAGLTHGGGTDAISFTGGAMFVSASNPSPDANGTTFSKPVLYKVTLSGTTATATPVFKDNSTATNATNGKTVTLNLSDPDSNEVMPAAAPQYAGDLLLTSQGDSEQIFLSHPGTAQQTATVLKLNTQVDDTAVTTGTGTLYVTDGATDKVIAITGPFSAGQVFTAVPNDSKVKPGTLGDLNLKTGSVSPFGKGFGSPKGLLFVH